MWPIRFVDGATPSKKKKIEKDDAKSVYKRPERKFQDKWSEGRPWLKFDPNENIMTCSICVEHAKNQTSDNLKNKHLFISGCSNFRYTSVTDHEKSKSHLAAQSVAIAMTKPDASRARKALISLHESKRKALELKFRNIHALIKHNRPISDFQWLNQLDRSKLLEIGETYNNQAAATAFLKRIADVERDKLKEMLEVAHYFSITMDGSTDDSSMEQESLFIRTCIKGTLKIRFMCIGEPSSTCSMDLLKFILDQFQKHKIDDQLKKCVGLGSDGASNMTGVKKGLVALLKNQIPEMIGVHCLAHRLELAFRDVVQKNQCYVQLTTLMLGLFYLYKRSPKQRKALKETFKVMGIKGRLPHRVAGSRWMPHMKVALDTVFKSYAGYISHLQDASHTVPKAEGLAKLLASYRIIAFGALLFDILQTLSRLSLALQSQDITLGDVHIMVESTKNILQDFSIEKSEKLQELLQTKRMCGYPLTGPFVDMTKTAEALTQGIKAALTTRFDDLSSDLQFTEIACLKNWPTELSKDYGNDHVTAVKQHFQKTLEQEGVQLDQLAGEWELLKNLVYKRYGTKLTETMWADVYSSFSTLGVGNILSLIDLLRSLPPTSVANETLFNQMKLAKTDRRHRLSADHLNDCMVVRIQSPNVANFDPTPAIEKWMISPAGQMRRMSYVRHKPYSNPNSTPVESTEQVDDIAQTESSTSAGDIPVISTAFPETQEEHAVLSEQVDHSEHAEPTENAESIEYAAEPTEHSEPTEHASDLETESESESESENEQSEKVNDLMVSRLSLELEVERE